MRSAFEHRPGADAALEPRCRLRGCVVFDKTFVIMALACAMAPFLGAGVFLVVHLF